jgi:hypothetical protein
MVRVPFSPTVNIPEFFFQSKVGMASSCGVSEEVFSLANGNRGLLGSIFIEDCIWLFSLFKSKKSLIFTHHG